MKTFKQYFTESLKRRIVSFDFDNTIANTRMTPDGKYVKDENGNLIVDGVNKDTVKKIREYHKNGYKIIITTARPGTAVNKEQVNNIIINHDLPIDKVYFTKFKPKWILLKKLAPEMHYDDSEKEVRNLINNGIPATLVSESYDSDRITAGWILPTGAIVHVPLYKHESYVKQNYSTFNLTLADIKKSTDISKLAVLSGAIKFHIFKNKYDSNASIYARRDIWAKEKSSIEYMLKRERVKEYVLHSPGEYTKTLYIN